MLEFQRSQYALAKAIRDPASSPGIAGIEPRRLRLYQGLFYNGVERLLASTFPVLRALSSDDAWHARVRDFYARHESRQPQFVRLAEEFLHYVEARSEAGEPPFLRELCHYEWLELALSMDEAELASAQAMADRDGDLLSGAPFPSPLAWPQIYDFPVHRIGPSFQPQQAPEQPTCLIVYRDADDVVRFMEINPLTARLLQLNQQRPQDSGRALLETVAAELNAGDVNAVIEAGLSLLNQLRERGIVLGTRRG